MYRERMNGYYPQVIQDIVEFQAIIDAEYPEFEALDECNEKIISDAYLLTMSEDRIIEWENKLGIRPLQGSSLEDRRETVIARIRGQGKLNTELINTIVKTFTGGKANSYIKDSVLHVEITPPPENKNYQFDNVKQELMRKLPAHLGLSVTRNYSTWGEIYNDYISWNDVLYYCPTWDDVLHPVDITEEVLL